jgi:hypothetical protein
MYVMSEKAIGRSGKRAVITCMPIELANLHRLLPTLIWDLNHRQDSRQRLHLTQWGLQVELEWYKARNFRAHLEMPYRAKAEILQVETVEGT